LLYGGIMWPLNESYVNYRQLKWSSKASSGDEKQTEEWQEFHVTS